MKSWIIAARPKTLTASLVPIVVATALAAADAHAWRAWISVWALLSSLFIQIGTNFFNDVIDFTKGTDTADRIGPLRVSQGALITPQKVHVAAVSSFALALVCGIPLIVVGGWPILLLGLVSLAFGYLYTGGPYPLAYWGLGDGFVIIFFGLLAVGGLYFLQTGGVTRAALLAGVQIGLLATVLIAINNLRDIDGDRKNSKRTLAVFLGPRLARIEIGLLVTLPFLLGLLWIADGHPVAAFLPFAIFPFALRLVRSVAQTPPSSAYNRFLAQGALLHLVFGLLLATGLIVR